MDDTVIKFELNANNPKFRIITSLLATDNPPLAEIAQLMDSRGEIPANTAGPSVPERLRLFAAYRNRGRGVGYPDEIRELHMRVFPSAARKATALYHKRLGYFDWDQNAKVYTLSQKARDELAAWESRHGQIGL
jgi:hypothetical protein